MAKRRAPSNRTRPRRESDATAPILSEIRSLRGEVRSQTEQVRVLGGLARNMAVILKARQPSIVIGPYLHEEFERDLIRKFLEKSQRTTTDLALGMDAYPKKVLRCIKRINRRALKREGVAPFSFDPATRSWLLDLQIVDAKELGAC